MPDYTIKAGDTLPIFEDTLKYANGTIAEPESIQFVMRALTATEPVVLTGTSAVVSKAKGEVSFSPSAADSVAGNYMASWKAKVAGKQMTFPTTGYLWAEVEPSLSTQSEAQIVGLPEVKDYLNIKPQDRTHDLKLIAELESIGPAIENVVGPVRIRVHDEWYEGGHTTIGLRHAPSYGYGTDPYLQLMAVSEYRGPIEYNLSIVGTPTQGTVYSTMEHGELGMITRRTAGGGTYTFWRDPKHPQQSIHVVYASGQEGIPPGVRLAALDTIRAAYENTMMVGKGQQTFADSLEPQMPLSEGLTRKAHQHLAPYRRHPSFA